MAYLVIENANILTSLDDVKNLSKDLLDYKEMYLVGAGYSVLHAIVMTFSLKKWDAAYHLVLRWTDGIFCSCAYLLNSFSYFLDLLSNVNGEIYEDVLTVKEDTNFGKKNISVSSSTGKLEVDGKIKNGSQWFSNLLNFAFNQKQHARDSYLYDVAKSKLRREYFN